jgi:ABC-type glutathione transport system ATPase component
MTGDLLSLKGVTKGYASGGLLARKTFNAVDGVSFALDTASPEIFAIIGESGSGKTTLARMILNMAPASAGTILFRGKALATIRGRRARLAFMRQVQPIFQNPYEAFNPLKRVDRYLYATARRLAGVARKEVDRVCDEALRKVGLSLAEVRGRFPHELSGGQLQRTAIARALISRPALLVADEPVSMVDASLRMSIVELFKALRDELGVSIIYITHDLATAYHISDRIIIMQRGRVVEGGHARAVLDDPLHPYSKLLKGAVLSPDSAGTGEQITPRASDPSTVPVNIRTV